MTLGEKLKEIRKRFGLSQEELAEMLNVSRQAITKWENDGGKPDIDNLLELSKKFGITVDSLLNNESELSDLSISVKLDKEKYGSKLSSYYKILKEYYPEPWKIYTITVTKKMEKVEGVLDVLTGGDYFLIKQASDLSPYYLVKKDNLKLLVNIKDWTMKVVNLPIDIDEQRFSYGDNKFTNCGELKIK